eukprot:TRINITY_DN27023_c0_g1_i4.p2 TRINITY_DN27023_c0_g1~~TRINITY_DN27023_c0_g1_i4.p2  ORF type:complete len:117 (+),score=20.69 TRINITY_DN27023_c0_g1_i4:101-451(+)
MPQAAQSAGTEVGRRRKAATSGKKSDGPSKSSSKQGGISRVGLAAGGAIVAAAALGAWIARGTGPAHEDDEWHELVRWIRSQGGKVHDGLRLDMVKHGGALVRGVTTHKAIGKGAA